MGGDGKSEKSSKEFGRRLGRVREKRFLTQMGLALLLNPRLQIDPSGVARLENGRQVKVFRDTIETISDICDCSQTERRSLLIAADRNPFADADGTTPEWREALIHVLSPIFNNHDVQNFMQSYVRQRKGYDLTPGECEVVFAEIRRILRI